MTQLVLSRIVIETRSPLALSSGGHDLGSSSDVARDWNGVPYIPATSLMGVWRSAAEASGKDADWEQWFGFTKGSRNSRGRASRIVLSDGLLLNTAGEAGRGLIPRSRLDENEFTRTNSPLIFRRERTRINHRGVADAGGHGKFDTMCLMKGVRFSFDIKAYVDDAEDADFSREALNEIISLIGQASFAVGGGKTNGLGRVRVQGFRQEVIDLSEGGAECLRKITAFRRQKDPFEIESANLKGISFDEKAVSGSFHKLLDLMLNGDGVFTAGTGRDYLNPELKKQGGSTVVAHPGTEQAVVWDGCQGKIDIDARPEFIIPGSEIKGAIAHRVAYHYNCLAGNLADENDFFSKEYQVPEALGRLLFGMAGSESGEAAGGKDSKKAAGGNSSALAGQLFFCDAEVVYEKPGVLRTHNRIDRITGGVMDKALFSEELVFKPSFPVRIMIKNDALEVLSGKKSVDGIDEKTVRNVTEALKRTVFDLANGLLPIGAKSGRTLCGFAGKIRFCHELLDYRKQQEAQQ
ncbi:MAG: hypothetical protein II922_04675 [Succinimonas sp.]|nr:hypothetical protein [Succinimonas sp.]